MEDWEKKSKRNWKQIVVNYTNVLIFSWFVDSAFNKNYILKYFSNYYMISQINSLIVRMTGFSL